MFLLELSKWAFSSFLGDSLLFLYRVHEVPSLKIFCSWLVSMAALHTKGFVQTDPWRCCGWNAWNDRCETAWLDKYFPVNLKGGEYPSSLDNSDQFCSYFCGDSGWRERKRTMGRCIEPLISVMSWLTQLKGRSCNRTWGPVLKSLTDTRYDGKRTDRPSCIWYVNIAKYYVYRSVKEKKI